MTTAIKARPKASGRINLRVQPQLKAKLLKAARLKKLSLSEFILESAQAAAQKTLAKRR